MMNCQIAAFMLAAGIALAQNPPSFEVTSIRPNNSPDTRVLFNMQTPGRFSATNVTVRRLIEVAYLIKDFQLSGGPSWIGSARFDINATAEAPGADKVATGRVNLMLQALLADRFKLVAHQETKEMPIYALVAANGGPKFKEVNPDAKNAANGSPRRPGAVTVRRGLLTAQEVTIAGLLDPLSNILGRLVVDRTGLTGKYDLKIEWRPDEMQVAMLSTMGVPEGFGAPPPDWPGPTLFTALEEQLGLKLTSQKGPVETLVIERIEMPSEN
jgi:uncharacterized protein (TIGR03435 family)